MPSTVSSSSTSAWAGAQSPFASHHSAASGADSPGRGASSATDALNSSGFIFCSYLFAASEPCSPPIDQQGLANRADQFGARDRDVDIRLEQRGTPVSQDAKTQIVAADLAQALPIFLDAVEHRAGTSIGTHNPYPAALRTRCAQPPAWC